MGRRIVTVTTTTKRLTLAEIKRELAEVARIGQTFVDADLCLKAYHPHADCFMEGDDMDYDPAAGVPLKKTLLRLERVARIPCSTTLWRRRPDDPATAEALLFGWQASPSATAKPSRTYQPPKLTPELRKAFIDGQPAWKTHRKADAREYFERGGGVRGKGVKTDRVLELFVPVTDSMGNISAVLEVFTAVVA